MEYGCTFASVRGSFVTGLRNDSLGHPTVIAHLTSGAYSGELSGV